MQSVYCLNSLSTRLGIVVVVQRNDKITCALECTKRRATIGRASLARENEVGGRRSIYSMLTYRTLFCFGRNNQTVPKLRISVILSEGLLQAEAVENFAGDNDHGNREF